MRGDYTTGYRTHFGADQVFMDVDDIPPGADFASHIDAKVGSCDAMVVVIGKKWLTARNAEGQLRLSDPNDFVGLEVSLALQRGVLVIPVLVGGAQIPKAEELRADLKPLARRNALTLNDPEFQRDADILVQTLEKIPGLVKCRHRRGQRSESGIAQEATASPVVEGAGHFFARRVCGVVAVAPRKRTGIKKSAAIAGGRRDRRHLVG